MAKRCLIVCLMTVLSFFCFAKFEAKAIYDDKSFILDSTRKVTRFDVEMKINDDGSIDVSERYQAYCGKYYAFDCIERLSPQYIKEPGGSTAKIKIDSIILSDFSGNPISWSKSSNSDGLEIWKFDSEKNLSSGEHNFWLRYHASGAILNRFINSRLVWNYNDFNQNFYIDTFEARITFPPGITEQDVKISIDEATKPYINQKWDGNVLILSRNVRLQTNTIISASLPEGTVDLAPGGKVWMWYFLPLISFLVCLLIWYLYGRDPENRVPEVPTFSPPENLSPLEMGMIITNGELKKNHVSAQIIDMATRGIIKIKEMPPDNFSNKVDFEITFMDDTNLNEIDKFMVNRLFLLRKKGEILYMSNLCDNFFVQLPIIENEIKFNLILDGYLLSQGAELKPLLKELGIGLLSLGAISFYLFNLQGSVIVAFAALIGLTIAYFMVNGVGIRLMAVRALIILFYLNIFLSEWGITNISSLQRYYQIWAAVAMTGIIIWAFSYIMPKRTLKGAKTLKEIDGFKLYMKTAEQHRQNFLEEEGHFDKLLPYAMLFGLTHLWLANIADIYYKNDMRSYQPDWFLGLPGRTKESSNIELKLSQMSNSLEIESGELNQEVKLGG